MRLRTLKAKEILFEEVRAVSRFRYCGCERNASKRKGPGYLYVFYVYSFGLLASTLPDGWRISSVFRMARKSTVERRGKPHGSKRKAPAYFSTVDFVSASLQRASDGPFVSKV